MKISRALKKDTIREIRNGKSRFFSIVVLVALAVLFLYGLRMAAPDMEATADAFFDAQNMMDIRIVSTLGITDEDVEVLSQQENIEAAEGSYGVDAIAVGSGTAGITVHTLSISETMNVFELIDGRMPQAADECIVEESILEDLALTIGDTITLDTGDDDYKDALSYTEYTIVGTCRTPLYASNSSKGTSTLGSGKVEGIIGLLPETYTLDYYTDLYLTAEGAAAMQTYADVYTEYIEGIEDQLEDLADARAALRLESIRSDAQEEIDDGWSEYEDAKAQADEELADAAAELADARQELDDGWAEYEDGLTQIADAREELEEAAAELSDALKTLEDGETEYEEGLSEYEDGLSEYEAGLTQYEENLAAYDDAYAQYEEGLALYEAGLSAYEEGLAEYEAGLSEYEEGQAQLEQLALLLEAGYITQEVYDAALAALEEAAAELSAAAAQLEEAAAELSESRAVLEETAQQLSEAKAQLDAAEQTLSASKTQLDAAYAALLSARAELDDGWSEYYDGLSEYKDGLSQIETSEAELADALVTLEDGEAEYEDGLSEYEEAEADALEELEDARQELLDAEEELAEIDECTWYVLDRSSNAGYVGYQQEAQRMANLALFFPLIFFLVAALVCLTTMTRMVEEQRVQIGCLKALGYSKGQIAFKYVVYGLSASLLGGAIGLAIGGTLIPSILMWAWSIMYDIPGRVLVLRLPILLFSVGMAVLCCVAAVAAATLSALRSAPAALMRPRAPKAGKRVWIEHITPLWKRLNFSMKVSARNLFRYQKRFWMTVIGIMGCTALIVAGFGIRDSINAIMDKQFGEISIYDAAVTVSEEPDADMQALLDEIQAVSDYAGVYLAAVDFETEAYTLSGYVMSAQDAETLNGYVDFHTRKGKDAVPLTDEGVIISEKTARMLEVEIGDTITVKVDDEPYTVEISGICENYLYHYIYMTDSYYASVFGEDPQVNTLLVNFALTDTAAQEATTAILSDDSVTSISNNADNQSILEDQLQAVNACMVVIIGAAAALAFVVLFNLSNINITERSRELATLKVLGFRYPEMNAYVMRESIILTLLGMLAGLVAGRYLSLWLMTSVEIEIAMFGREVRPVSFVYAALLTILFSLVANKLAGRKLRKIDMVESLKAVE